VTAFERGDLLRLTPRRGAYDLILCRNTAIYFTEDVRDALHAGLAEALRPGGCLLVGATERVADPAAIELTPVLPFTYRKH
jgi:chemotaxis protein methyltransferase CheR